MLSALQQRVAIVFADLPEAEGFALAGGGALIVRGAVNRETHDLASSSATPMQSIASCPHSNRP